MSGMLNLWDVLELVDNTFNNSSLAQDELVMQSDQDCNYRDSTALDGLNQRKNTTDKTEKMNKPPTIHITNPPVCWSGSEEGAQISREKEREI